MKQLLKAFREAVDVETCKSIGPERSYKGSFNVRIHPDIHRKAALKAQVLGISLNELVEQAISTTVSEPAITSLGKTRPRVVASHEPTIPADDRGRREKPATKSGQVLYGRRQKIARKK